MGRSSKNEAIAAWIGIDWADASHHVCEYTTATEAKKLYEIQQSGEALQDWVADLRERYPGQRVAVVLEQARGGLIYALMNTDFIEIYPVNPEALAKFRKALYSSGSKNDPTDAELAQELVRLNPSRFRVWKPDDEQTRRLQMLTQDRRKLVDDMTALRNRLTGVLKTYYPQALTWAGELQSAQAVAFLDKWPTLADLQRTRPFRIREFYQKHGRPRREDLDKRIEQIRQARPLTEDPAVVTSGTMMVQSLIAQIEPLRAAIAKYDAEIARIFQQHPDEAVFKSFPGAGAVLAPRLLAAFGADRERFESAGDVQEFSGIAPVSVLSGKASWVHRRWACPKFILQTFHEFADHSRKSCSWAKRYYLQQRAKGSDHHPAVRSLAYKWIRIMYRCWYDRTTYHNDLYEQSLAKRGSPLAIASEAAA